MDHVAMQWIVGRDTGMSSKAIWSQMVGVETDKGWSSHPSDPDDLGRCLRLLALKPEWRLRLPEMSARSPSWAALVARWDELEASMADEVGIDWSKGRNAPATYNLMRAILFPA